MRRSTPLPLTAAIVNQAPQRPSVLRPGLPPELDGLIMRALEKDPELRAQTANDLRSALKLLARGSSPSPLAPYVPEAPGESAAGSARDLGQEIAALRSWRAPARRRHVVLLLAAAVLAAGLGFGLYRWSAQLSAPEAPPKVIPLIGLPGLKEFPALSPDESRIAFAWDGGADAQFAPRDIYVKTIEAGEPVRLTASSEDEIAPDWSPDGRYVAFERVLPTHHDVYRIPALGGTEQKIAETLAGTSWSPDGATLAVTGVPAAGSPAGIFLVSIETGARRRLTTAPSSTPDMYPVFSPDGKTVAYQRSYPGVSEFDIFVVPVKGGTPKQVTFGRRTINGLTWTADSHEIVYASLRAGVPGLWRVAAKGGPARAIPSSPNPSFPVISRGGNKLAWTESSIDSNIYRAEGPGFAAGPAPGIFGPLAPMLVFPGEDHSPEFSPDGEKVVFASGRTGGEDLWLCDRDGRHLTRLTTSGGPTGSPHWSPDGRWIAFDSHIRSNAAIYVVSAQGGHGGG